ncbi:TIGR04222 domain-containing membrane protein [Streptosporangium sp. NBC_01755]|uniref:TIGR04222 domain-containing membrane protein n=1 Tax=Streptosporangium sp. NBC_01755 TaxID=2975949 RepID=UPI002DDBCDC3|nr:TIGR04222 domain-containing membrane protein [Streptosporangium sp. NBC_01755]WSD02447.1 TIGR04222 domain-containing membrane protein [Streptosporangium sp. NBC_01755]
MGSPLFVIVLVTGLVIAFTAITLSREHRRVRSAVARYHGGPPTPYELAYLAGGQRRVINTALGMLTRAGAIRVSRGGQVSLVAGAVPSSHPIEHSVTEALARRGGSAPVGELRHAVAGGQAVDGLRYRLLGLGLLVPESVLDYAEGLLNRLLVASVVETVVVGVTLATGAAAGAGVLALLVGLLSAFAGFTVHLRQKRALRDVLSHAGRDVLASARRTYVRGARPVAPDLALAVGIPVALYGLGELNEPGLEEESQSQSQSVSGSGSG